MAIVQTGMCHRVSLQKPPEGRFVSVHVEGTCLKNDGEERARRRTVSIA